VVRVRGRLGKGSALRTILGISKYNYGALAISSLATLVTARLIGPIDKGIVAGATAWTVLLVELGSLGFPQAITFEIARDTSSVAAVRAVGARFARVQVLAVLGVGAAIFAAAMSGRLRGNAILYLATVPLAFFLAYRLAELQGARRYLSWNRVRSIGAVAPVILGLAAALLSQSAAAVLCGYGIGLAIATLGVTYAGRRQIAHPQTTAQHASGLARRMLRYGAKTGLVGLMSGANRQFDQAILALIIASRDLGVYAVAVSLSAVIAPIGAAYAGYALASVPGLEGMKAKRDLTVRLAGQGAVVFGVMSLVGAMVAPQLLSLAFGDAYAGGGTAARILFLAAGFLAENYLLVNAFLGMGKTSAPLAAQGAGLACTLVLLVLLVPSLGFEGAAWASLLSYVVTCAMLTRSLLRMEPEAE
jgi:O-antigen/teichoic acid export membrane protein